MIIIKTKQEIEKMRRAGRVVAAALAQLEASIIPNKTTTADLDKLAASILEKWNAIPSFKGYRGYPAVICVAVNEEVVHGIPGPRVLKEGDIVGIDIGAIVEGYHADSAITVGVGEISPLAAKLIRVTREALFCGIAKARVGNRLTDISAAIQEHAEKNNFSVVRDLVGHGIGRSMHEDPQVPNFGRPGRGPRLEEGMTLAIEPMLNAGGYQVESLQDQWTIVTKDRSLSAHFEHTVAVTSKGPDILTLREGEEIPALK
ncbi:MAG: type I methionyl aminopeptidase [Armatimonadetes bacterium]|nr:type I methionyl aminopeptidase [Armatimonadota bacterium]